MPLRSHSVVAGFAPRPLSFAPSSDVGAAAVRTYHVIYLPKTAGLDVLVARARGESAERRATRVRRASSGRRGRRAINTESRATAAMSQAE